MIKSDPYHGCEKKKRYATRQEAEDLARIQSSKWPNRRKGIKLTVYGCRFCGGWHMTKRSQLAPVPAMQAANA